jgi:hypothetical protein
VTEEIADAATAAEQAEEKTETENAFQRLANRPVNPKLRGGIGRGGMIIDLGG